MQQYEPASIQTPFATSTTPRGPQQAVNLVGDTENLTVNLKSCFKISVKLHIFSKTLTILHVSAMLCTRKVLSGTSPRSSQAV